MNKQERENYGRLVTQCAAAGLTVGEVDTLLRCARTLTRWACRECGDGSNWAIEREQLPDGGVGRPFMVYHGPDGYVKQYRKYAIRDMERAAIKRAEAVAAAHGLTVYRQGDPRGCALYLIRKGDIPEGGDVCGYYHRGIAVCF
jgi:hypothetical protein